MPDIHINAPTAAPYYFGVNLVALAASFFTLARFIDCVGRDDARIETAQSLG